MLASTFLERSLKPTVQAFPTSAPCGFIHAQIEALSVACGASSQCRPLSKAARTLATLLSAVGRRPARVRPVIEATCPSKRLIFRKRCVLHVCLAGCTTSDITTGLDPAWQHACTPCEPREVRGDACRGTAAALRCQARASANAPPSTQALPSVRCSQWRMRSNRSTAQRAGSSPRHVHQTS